MFVISGDTLSNLNDILNESRHLEYEFKKQIGRGRTATKQREGKKMQTIIEVSNKLGLSTTQHKKKWGAVPEVSAADLDNDGDLDIVYSRAGVLYVGTAIQIIENLGNKKFKDHGIFPLVEAPADFVATHEGNEWNDFIEDIRFRDLDKDGDIDLYLSSSMSPKTNGAVVINNGNFDFSLIMPPESYGLYEMLAEAATK